MRMTASFAASWNTKYGASNLAGECGGHRLAGLAVP